MTIYFAPPTYSILNQPYQQAIIDDYLAGLASGDVELDVDGTPAADALCKYTTTLAIVQPVAPLDDKDADASAEEEGLPAGYIAVAVVGSVMGLIMIVAVYARFAKAARRRMH